MTAYAFRPISVSDLPTIRRWLETPHVAEWWHDPSEQFELVTGDLADPDMAQFIVSADAREFAYLQCYNLGVWDAGFGPQPEGARGWHPERRASRSIPTPPTHARSGPMRGPDFAASASSIRRTARRC